MIDIEYTGDMQESANATLDFLTNRPFLKMMFWFMRGSCILLALGFAITLYNHATRPQDWATMILAGIWIFYYKSLNRWLISKNLKRIKFHETKNIFKIDQKSIFCKLPPKNPIDIPWKKLKYILQNNEGYIIPLTGITNGGRFLWLPFRAFADTASKDQFLELAARHKLKIKSLVM